MNIATYLIRAIILIIVGVVVANIVLESNLMRRLFPITKPLCHATNLPKECIFSLFTSFLNPTAGKSALAGFYREGKIGDKETILTVIMCTFPIVVGESLFRVQAPIAFVLLGPTIGGIYISLNLFSSFLQSFAAFVYSKSFLPPQKEIRKKTEFNVKKADADADVNGIKKNLKTALKKSSNTLKRVIPIMTITFLAIYFLFELDCMDYIRLSVAALLTKGAINAKQAIVTLLIGSMIVITLIYIRYSFSMYVSLFGKFGVKIAAINYMSSMIAKIITIFLVQTFL
jgi:hypothetical protein